MRVLFPSTFAGHEDADREGALQSGDVLRRVAAVPDDGMNDFGNSSISPSLQSLISRRLLILIMIVGLEIPYIILLVHTTYISILYYL